MKKTMIILMLTLGVNVSAQMSKFEGLWKSDSSSYYTLINYNDIEDFLTVNTFSFYKNTVILEEIISEKNDTLKTISYEFGTPKDTWNIYIDYVVISDTIIHAHLTGSTTQTLIYKQIID